MTTEKLSGEKCSVQTALALLLWETQEGTVPQERVLRGFCCWIPALAKQQERHRTALGSCWLQGKLLAPECSSLSSVLEEGPAVLTCPAADGAGTADPAHAE